MQALFILTICIILAAWRVQADDALEDLSSLSLLSLTQVSIATGIEQTLLEVPAVTTLITDQEIERMGARDLDEVLRSVPGLQVSYNQLNNPVYTVRGVSFGTNAEILMLINGIRVNNAQEGSTGGVWGGLPVQSIARIEVIRGPGSAVYGADAFTGVINIITKQADEIDGTEVGIRVGHFDTKDVWLLHGGTWQDFEVVATFEYNDTDGHAAIIGADAQTFIDQQLGTNTSFAPASYNGGQRTYDARLDIARDKWRLRGGLHFGRDIGTGAGIAEVLDPAGEQTEQRMNVDSTYQDDDAIQDWQLTTQLSYLRSRWSGRYFLYPRGAFGGSHPDGLIGQPSSSEQRWRFDVAGIYSGFAQHLLRLGAGYVYDDMYEVTDKRNFVLQPDTGLFIPLGKDLNVSDTDDVFVPETSRYSWYAFIQDSWSFAEQWKLTAGIRYDRYSDFGSTTNPRLGLVWATAPDLFIKLLYGRAFRAPSFNELTITNNPIQLGNPDLKPEVIDSWELAFDYQRPSQGFYTTLNFFIYTIEDKIIYVLDDIGRNTETASNAGQWRGQGLEFEARWDFMYRSSLLFNYAFQDAEDENTGHALGKASNHQAYLRADWTFMPFWSLHGQVHWAAEWDRPLNDPRDSVADHVTVDVMLRRKDLNGSHTNFAFGVRNLFNDDVRFASSPMDTNGVINRLVAPVK